MKRSVSSKDQALRGELKYDTQQSILGELRTWLDIVMKYCIECLILLLKFKLA